MPEDRAPDPTPAHVRKAFQGDAESLEWVVTRFTPLLLAQASYRMGSSLKKRVEAGDIVAEAWLVALPRLAGLAPDHGRSTPRLLAFLSTTILNIINRTLDKHIRRQRLEARPDATAGPTEEDPVNEVQAPITGIITRAARGEISAAIASSLAKLPKEDREAVILRGIEGLSNEEAAQAIGELETTVSHRYRRALRKLREALPRSIMDELIDD